MFLCKAGFIADIVNFWLEELCPTKDRTSGWDAKIVITIYVYSSKLNEIEQGCDLLLHCSRNMDP
jgi:hypothetical protein